MGRTATTATPSANGAIILYGRSRTATTLTHTVALPDPPADTPTKDGLYPDGKAGLTESLSKHTIKESRYFKRTLDWRNSATITAVSNLAVDILAVFEQVPYVKIVANLVQQIISISDEIQANRDRSKELVSKVMAYARVVFDALLGLNEQTASGLKEDLEELAHILRSIYSVLQKITGPNYASLFNRLVYRNEISSMLAEQDRKLDTTITAFQLKSAIVNRSGSEKSVGGKITSNPRQHVVGLRAKPQVVYGRSKEIELIVASLLFAKERRDDPTCGKEGTDVLPPPRLCILGPGGIGKTTLALSIVHHDRVQHEYQERRFFVPCEAATSPELLLSQLAISLGLLAEDIQSNIFEAVLGQLRICPCLLVLDNFETTWDPLHTRSEVEIILIEISSLTTVTLLLTMRGSQKPAGTLWSNVIPPLQPIDIESAISIFTTICQKNDKYAVDLIRAVDCVPLAVTLLANLAAVDGETTEALWSRWEEESTSMVENGQDRLNSLETSVQLSLYSPRMQKDAGAIKLLSAFSLLPDGISASTLCACVTGLTDIQSVKKSVSTLRQNALIYEDINKDLRILSPIRLFMCSKHPPPIKTRSFLYDHFIALALQGDMYYDPVLRAELQREANNINTVLIDALNNSSEEDLFRIVEATISFCHFTYMSGQGSTQALVRAIEKLESMDSISAKIILKSPLVSSKPNKLWQRAFVGFVNGPSKSKAILSQATPSEIDTTALKLCADCLGCHGQVLSRQSQFEQAREKFERAKKLHVEIGDHCAHAYDLLNIGLLYSRNIETLQQALETITEAVNLHEKHGEQTGKAYDLLGLGHVYQDLCNFSESEVQYNLAATLFSEMGDDHGQAAAMNGLGNIMVSLSSFNEAEKYFVNAIRLNISLGDIVGEAENLGGLATTFLLRSRFTEAQRTILRALTLRQPFTDPEHLHILGRILLAMDDIVQAKSVLSRSLTIQKDIGSMRGQAANLLFLGYIEFDQGNCQDAQELAGQALQIKNSRLMHADINLLLAMINIRLMNFSRATNLLRGSLDEFIETGNTLGEAFCLYVRAILHLRQAYTNRAVQDLMEALDLHTRVENVQGQADDLNKMCEALLSQGSIEEAMTLSAEALALHIQIDDKRGQGDDLYIRSSLFLAQGRLSDADYSAQKALKLHKASESLYGMAKDSAILGFITWQRLQQQDDILDGENPDTYSTHMERALAYFRTLGAVGEVRECMEQEMRMRGRKLTDSDIIEVSSWNIESAIDGEDADSDEDADEDAYDVQGINTEHARSTGSTQRISIFPVYLHK